ncbi:conserved hypothetical protein [Pediculus humanus corporis]|uniref:Uncharacterized protein n=1 Tax=Pediculus humanus subsp. corporis TaxID=121224 RepID=E0VV06_PEDHC|nr:uncharacterized protein Phum_PHUM457180 [Pediculus humanus corporis]EEB17212.1 conserved hypothetical protein [Pediculus humanus corporis]
MAEEPSRDSPVLPFKTRKLSRPKLKIPQINISNISNNIPQMNRLRHPDLSMPGGCAIPIGNTNGPFGIFQFHPTKASEYMNKRYENFKDFTKSTAKSGLSFGEKTLFWINGRVRQLSKRWFTHIFLFLVVLLYSFLGSLLFVTVEGTHEDKEKADINKELNLFIFNMRRLAMDKNVVFDGKLWEKNVKELIAPYETQLLESYSHGVTPDQHKTWSFWNSMFYCGTIYTTIGELFVCLFVF